MNSNKSSVNAEMLDRMYKNVKMGSDSMINIMSRVSDDSLRRELTSQLDAYEGYSRRVGDMIYESGGKPKEEGLMTKMSAKIGMAMNTMTDSTSSHLAQMVIEGATMGMTDMTKIVREYENRECSEAPLKLAREIAEFEDKSIEKLKKFL
ncbi:MAG: hypothetical protein IJV72_05175 [Clostridia bacterium]|nr:hypothetical protein [Clostridia bacterium]